MSEPLSLRTDFPAVSTADWEAAIRKDLKGADYEQALIWKSDEGISIRPYYRREDLESPDAVKVTPRAVQELGFALADAAKNRSPESVFSYTVGSNYFFEIAKLRAIRKLWPSAIAALHGEAAKTAVCHIHARTSTSNKRSDDRVPQFDSRHY